MHHKNTIEVICANLAAVLISVKEINELLTTVSISLAIGFTMYKFYKESK